MSNPARQLRRDRPLLDQELERFAPSIFAEAPHDSRSERYNYLPTIDVLNALRDEGFHPFFVAQCGTRIPGKAAYTKHMLRLRQNFNTTVNQDFNEIVLINSHDGTSAYKMMAGMFRFVCANGMILGDTHSEVSVRHMGDTVIGDVIEGAYTVVDNFDLIAEHREIMQSATLKESEQLAFAKAALSMKNTKTVQPERLLIPRRQEDKGNTVWQTFNTIQENMMKGGLSGRSASGRRTRTRPIGNIDTDVNINRQLWVLGSEMAKLRLGQESQLNDIIEGELV